MDNSFGPRPPWTGQNPPSLNQSYNNIPPGMDPRFGPGPGMVPPVQGSVRYPQMNGYGGQPGIATPASSIGPGGGYPMWDMDMPSQMFMQAMNFDRMVATGQVPQGLQPRLQNGSARDGGFGGNVPTKANEDTAKRSEAGMDLIEQQQAMEQSRLLSRFKELRQWQQQQQELLMSQQQQQLSLLRNEQHRVQGIISKQRDQQWGGGRTNTYNEMSTPPRHQLPPGTDPTQLLDNGTQSKVGLPRPVIYVPPKEDDDEIKTNPDLFSDTNSNRGSQATVDDGMFPIPDSASEASVDVGARPPPVNLAHPHYQARFNPHETDAPKKHQRSLLEKEENEDSFQSPDLPPAQKPLLPPSQERVSEDREGELGAESGREESDRSEESDTEDDDSDDTDSEDGDSDENQETQIEVNADGMNHDEIPISGSATKTFEQLLEEQIKAEEDKLRQASTGTDSPSHPKRNFLKKGEGISRFEGKPTQRPARRKKHTTGHSNTHKSTGITTTAAASQKVDTTGASKPPVKTTGQQHGKPTGKHGNKPSSHATNKPAQKKDKKQKSPTGPKSLAPKSSANQVPKGDKKVGSLVLKKPKRPESIPDDTSFVANLKERQKESERDLEELDEFEILEDFADNMSFCSNSSIVTKGMKGLKTDRILAGALPKIQQSSGRPDISPRSALIKRLELEKARNFHKEPSKPLKTLPENESSADLNGASTDNSSSDSSDDSSYEDLDDSDDDKNVANTSQTKQSSKKETVADRLSANTKVSVNVNKGFSETEAAISKDDKVTQNAESVLHSHKSKDEYKLTQDKCDHRGEKIVKTLNYETETTESESTFSDSESDSDDSDMDYKVSKEIMSPTKAIVRKVAGRDERTAIGNSDILSDSNTNFLGSSLNASSFAPNAKSPIVISREIVPSSRVPVENDKFSYHSDSDSITKMLTRNQSDEDGSDISDAEDGFRSQSKKSKFNEKKLLHFDDDDDEWEDVTPQILKQKRKRRSEETSEHDTTLVEDPTISHKDHHGVPSDPEKPDDTPPTSKLMSKLFPRLKTQQSKQQEQQQQQDKQKLQAVTQSTVGDGIQSKAMHEKLVELEREIEKFRNENTHLSKLRAEREEGLSKLKQQIAEFEAEKTDELRRLEEFKAEEMKKLKHERKVFEKYRKSAQAGPDKKEREEIEMLKSQLMELQEEVKRKESRWTSTNSRLRTKVESLEQENDELKDEIKLMEKKRLEWLQKDQSKAKSRLGAPMQMPGMRSSTPTGEDGDYYGGDPHMANGRVPPLHGHDHFNDLSTTSSIRSNMSLKPSQNQPKINVSSSFPPHSRTGTNTGSNASEHSHNRKDNNHTNHSTKSNISNNTKGNQSKPNITHSKQPIKGSAHHGKAGLKPGSKSAAAGSKAGNHGEKATTLRASLNEDKPRQELDTVAVPQDVSIYETDGEVSMAAPTNLPRKFASKPSVDKSVIDKGNNSQYEETQHSDGKVERVYSNGAREILFSNGTRKEISADGQSIVVSFFNGDMKQIMPDQRVIYFYADAQTTHINYPDGLEILQFPNGQTEKLYPDGTKEITFTDQTVKYLFPNGLEESIFPDGTVIRLEKNGDKTMEFPNGQREIHTQEYKKREYPDGTVKTVFPDGRQETRYCNGRLRVKDKDGNVIVDRLC